MLSNSFVISQCAIDLLKQTWLQCEKKQQKRRFFSQLDDFDQDVNINDTVSSGWQNFIINNHLVDQEFSVNNVNGISTSNENTLKV